MNSFLSGIFACFAKGLTYCLIGLIGFLGLWGILSPVALADQTVLMGSMTDGGLVFSPQTVTVMVGETVTWVNQVLSPHNVIFDLVPEGVDEAEISLKNLVITPGPAHRVTFKVSGTYTYYCTPHRGANMAGTVIVK